MVLKNIREMRSRQNIPPRDEIEFANRCDEANVSLLRPMERYFLSMAKAKNVGWGPEIQAFKTGAQLTEADIDVFVNLADYLGLEPRSNA